MPGSLLQTVNQTTFTLVVSWMLHLSRVFLGYTFSCREMRESNANHFWWNREVACGFRWFLIVYFHEFPTFAWAPTRFLHDFKFPRVFSAGEFPCFPLIPLNSSRAWTVSPRYRPPVRWRRGVDGNHHPEATQGALRLPRRVWSAQPALRGVPWISLDQESLMPHLVVSIKLYQTSWCQRSGLGEVDWK